MEIEKLIDDAVAILQRRGKISYAALRLGLSVDAEVLEVIRDELVEVLGVADDVDGKMLVLRAKEQDADSGLREDEDVAERRVLTVMFCDLVGSTKLSTQLDSEDLRNVFAQYQSEAAEAIVAAEGYVAQYLGDGILAYFGYPRIHESDAVRAVSTGLDIIARIEQLSQAIEAEYGAKLQVRIGIHSGEVVIGDIGAEARKETLALGEVPNVAARLQGLANPNEIVVSGQTRNLLGVRVELDSLGDRELAGIGKPVPVYSVVGLSGQARFAEQTSGVIVGRDKEIAALRNGWQSVASGQGLGVYLTGEAGIGKTTLLRHLLRTESIDESQRIVVRGQDETSLISLRPFANALVAAWDLPDTAGNAFELVSARMPSQPIDEKVLVAEALGIVVPESARLPEMTPQVRRHRTLNALAAALLRVNRNERRLVLIEDLHWFDATSLELVHLLIDGLAQRPVMLIMTARPEYEPGWTSTRIETVAVSRLTQADMATLIKEIAHVRDLPAELVQRITARAEGVPLFLEELTKTAFETDAIKVDQDGYVTLDGELDDEVIPVSIYGCLMTRLDQTVVARQLAQLGAIIGNRFQYALLQVASELDDATLQRALLDLIKSGIVKMTSARHDATYEFSHAMLRDAIYQSLLRATRRALHGTIADTLVERFADQAEREPETVAFHLTRGGRGTEALHYWRLAGLSALGRFANTEAVDYFSRALETSREIADIAERNEVQLALTVLKAAPLMATRGWGAPEVRRCYEEARRILDEIEGKTHTTMFPTLVGLASYFIVRADWAEARRLVSRYAAIAEDSAAPNLIVEACSEFGVIEAYSGDPQRSLELFDRAIEHYEVDRYQEHLLHYGRNALVATYTARALTAWSIGRRDEAMEDCDKGLAVARNPYHPFSVAWAMCAKPIISLLLGDVDKVSEHIEQYCQFSEEQGFPYWLGQGLVYRGWGYLLRGQLDEAGAEMQRGLAILEASGTLMLQALVHWPYARLQVETGDLDGALDTVESSRQFILESGESWFAPETENLYGQVLEAREGAASPNVLKAYRRAYELAESRGTLSMKLHAATSIARVLREQDKTSEARAVLAPAIDAIAEGRGAPDMLDALHVLKTLN